MEHTGQYIDSNKLNEYIISLHFLENFVKYLPRLDIFGFNGILY